jgi:hypothetical protein
MSFDPEEFYDDWPDENSRERVKIHVKEIYETHKQLRNDSLKFAFDYGKWTSASLLLLHSGAIFLIAGGKDNFLPLSLITRFHVPGVVFALGIGFFAYLNFMYAAVHYEKFLNPQILYRKSGWPIISNKTDGVGATMYAAVCCGMLSLAMLIFSGNEFSLLLAK